MNEDAGFLLFFMLGGIGYLYWRSPALQPLTYLLLLACYGAFAIGAPIFVVLAIRLPRHEYGAAIGTLLVGLLVAAPCFFIAKASLPGIIRDLRTSPWWD